MADCMVCNVHGHTQDWQSGVCTVQVGCEVLPLHAAGRGTAAVLGARFAWGPRADFWGGWG
eukprot:12352657-Alexandrium_andersonii.AAC.1